MEQTQITAENWAKQVIKEKGIKEARNIMYYNVTKNQFYRESNTHINYVWSYIKKIENEIDLRRARNKRYCKN